MYNGRKGNATDLIGGFFVYLFFRLNTAMVDLAKIREYCPCYTTTSDSILQRDVDFILSMLSRMAGWQKVENETLCKSVRTQVEKIDVECCDCTMLKIPVNYKLIDIAIPFQVTIIKEGKSQIVCPLGIGSSGYYSEIQSSYMFDTGIDLTGTGVYIPRCCKDECEDWYVKLVYTAGYDPLPNEVYGIICFMLNAYALLKLGCSDAQVSNSACSRMDSLHWASYLKRNKVGEDEQEFQIVDISNVSLPFKVNQEIENMLGIIRNIYRVNSIGLTFSE